jgi:ubiquitin C-terminal hydrolase
LQDIEGGQAIDSRPGVDLEHLSKAAKDDQRAVEELAVEAWSKQVKKSASIVSDVAMGQLIVQTVCETCSKASYSFKHFHVLELDLPQAKASTLDDLLTSFSSPMLIDSFACPSCTLLRKGSRRRFIYKLPPVFIVSLNRFKKTPYSDAKNQCFVSVELTGQDLSKHEKGGQSSPAFFDLYMIVVASSHQHHHGSLADGQYNCSIFDNAQWNIVDDEIVRTLETPSVVSFSLTSSTIRVTSSSFSRSEDCSK